MACFPAQDDHGGRVVLLDVTGVILPPLQGTPMYYFKDMQDRQKTQKILKNHVFILSVVFRLLHVIKGQSYISNATYWHEL